MAACESNRWFPLAGRFDTVRRKGYASYDEIFQTEEARVEASQEKVIDIPLTELHPFKNHPFKVTDDESMLETAKSITKHGVLVPVIARPREDGGYELISGHRRKRASELAGMETLPVIVRNLDDDAATIIMVDSNIQRENILPSERALAYKLKLVKERLQRIDSTHIEYVFECLDKNTTFIRNIKKYLLTTLFNAPSTIDSYYTALVKHDLYGTGSHFYQDLGRLIKSNE